MEIIVKDVLTLIREGKYFNNGFDTIYEEGINKLTNKKEFTFMRSIYIGRTLNVKPHKDYCVTECGDCILNTFIEKRG